jgi:hypothetical protein
MLYIVTAGEYCRKFQENYGNNKEMRMKKMMMKKGSRHEMCVYKSKCNIAFK